MVQRSARILRRKEVWIGQAIADDDYLELWTCANRRSSIIDSVDLQVNIREGHQRPSISAGRHIGAIGGDKSIFERLKDFETCTSWVRIILE